MRLTKAIININNLKKNYLNIRNKVGYAKIMSVVKADAYGHNLKFVVDAFNSLGKSKPEYFAVATADEGVELRNLKVKKPILVFDPVDKFQVYKFFDNDLIASVFTKEHLNILLKEKKRLKIKNQIIVHIKVDTGMNRLGIDFKTASNFVEMLSKKSDFKIDGIFTHFATSDIVNNDYTKLQIKRFDEVLKSLQKKNVNYGLAHAANSGAILDFPESYYDMVRPGIALYGYFPSQQTSESIKLYPVMSVISKVSTISEIETGETVSYGRRFKAKAKIKIISVPIGYADGFNRALTNKAKAIIKGKFYNQIGTVTMDRIMFDVNNDNINVNDKVVLLGKNGKLKIDAWDWSNLINTIPYEITCGISKRVPRVIKQ